MIALRSLQRQAVEAFLGDDSAALDFPIESGDTPPAVQIEVYRNNLRENYRKCLTNAYPIVERLVGEMCFRDLAAQYSRQYPSTNSDLQFFGKTFSVLLNKLYGESEFAYLPDVARLEWAIEEALIVPRSSAMEIGALSQVDASEHSRLRFLLRPGLSLIRTNYPVLEIWQANQADDERVVNLAAGGEQLVVMREGESAEIRRLDAGAYALAECFADGLSLSLASERLDADKGFDLSASLNSLFLNRCLGDFEITSGESLDS